MMDEMRWGNIGFLFTHTDTLGNDRMERQARETA
jgi:hypothetical protein